MADQFTYYQLNNAAQFVEVVIRLASSVTTIDRVKQLKALSEEIRSVGIWFNAETQIAWY
jgi:hypothetical protein